MQASIGHVDFGGDIQCKLPVMKLEAQGRDVAWSSQCLDRDQDHGNKTL